MSEERHLQDRLHAIAGRARPPIVAFEADLRRGRRRLVQVRVALAGATTAALACVVGFAGLAPGSPTATEIPPATQPASVLPATPSESPSATTDGGGDGDGGEGASGVGDRPNTQDDGAADEPTGTSSGEGSVGEVVAGTGGRGPRSGHGTTTDPQADSTQDASESAPGASPTGAADGQSGAPTSTSPGTTTGALSAPSSGDPTSSTSGSTTGSTTGEPTGEATGSPTGDPTEAPTGDPTDDLSDDPADDPAGNPAGNPNGVSVTATRAALRAWNAALASDLDPRRANLARYTPATRSTQVRSEDAQFLALRATFAWGSVAATSPFSSTGTSTSTGTSSSTGNGAGLEVQVATGWDQVDWQCGASYATWTCSTADADEVDGLNEPGTADSPRDVERAETATHDGVVEVAVERADGQVVVLTAGAGLRRPAPSPIAADDLLRAAADPRLVLPGDPPVAPPTLDTTAFAAEGRAALVLAANDETFAATSRDRSPQIRGDWVVGGVDRGRIGWSAAPVYSADDWTCQSSYRACYDTDYRGEAVHIALLGQRLGGGWLLEYDGSSYATRVYVADRTFPKRRAFAFLTDQAWQPQR